MDKKGNETSAMKQENNVQAVISAYNDLDAEQKLTFLKDLVPDKEELENYIMDLYHRLSLQSKKDFLDKILVHYDLNFSVGFNKEKLKNAYNDLSAKQKKQLNTMVFGQNTRHNVMEICSNLKSFSLSKYIQLCNFFQCAFTSFLLPSTKDGVADMICLEQSAGYRERLLISLEDENAELKKQLERYNTRLSEQKSLTQKVSYKYDKLKKLQMRNQPKEPVVSL